MTFVDRAVGIDLGTTNSEIALLDPSERELVVHADRFGRRTVPSAVAWDAATQSIIVGRAARQRRGSEGVVESIKRRMGQSARVAVGPHSLTPTEVSGRILAELRARMLDDLRARAPSGIEPRVDRAVITVPAYFDAPQVAATREAGTLAGLDVLAVLQEPTAAAMYHTWRGEIGDGVFLVYDLGGGTFDVSILRSIGGEQQVLAIDGDNYLGGDDLDRRFASRLRDMLRTRGHALAREDDARTQRLVHLAQEIKETLSTEEVAHVRRDAFVMDDAGEAIDVELEIGRGEWEQAVADIVEQTIGCCERAIARAEEIGAARVGEIERVILVGGSTRTPLVARRVREAIAARTRSIELARAEVDTCVALGAAIHAATLGGFRIGDDRGSARIVSSLVTKTPELRLGVRVEAPDATRAVVVTSHDRDLARAITSPRDERATRLAIPVDEDETPLLLRLLDAADAEITRLPFVAYRGVARPRASALSQPTVVAKDIAIEVVRAGRTDRKVLVPRGASVPFEVTTELATSDRSGAVVLRILANRLPIETLVLDVGGDVAAGTTVKLTLRSDAALRLEAHAEVAGRTLWATVDAAPRDATHDAIEAVLDEVARVERTLWGREAEAFQRATRPLVSAIGEADDTKRGVLLARLRVVLEDARGADGERLSPPLARFESTLDGLRRVIYVSETGVLGRPIEHWEERIADLDQRGRAAWDTSDEGAWRRANHEAQALYETAAAGLSNARRSDDPAYLALRLTATRAWGERLLRALDDLDLSRTAEVRALQNAERESLRDAIRGALLRMIDDARSGEAVETRRALERAAAELDRVEKAIERLPSIGVVTDR
jgi:molecular chaperone DnaK